MTQPLTTHLHVLQVVTGGKISRYCGYSAADFEPLDRIVSQVTRFIIGYPYRFSLLTNIDPWRESGDPRSLLIWGSGQWR